MLPQVDELRAQVVREQRARNRRRGWTIAAVLVVVAGGVALLLPKLASEQKVDVATLNCPPVPPTPTQAAEKRAAELATKHTELGKRVLELDSRAAAQWGGAEFAAARKSLDDIGGMLERRKYDGAPKRRSRRSRRRSPKSKRACRRRWPRRLSEGKRALDGRRIRKRAPGLRYRTQDRTAATRKPPRGSARWRPRAAWCPRWPTPKTPRTPRTCPRRRRCSPTCSSAIPATSRPPRASRA